MADWLGGEPPERIVVLRALGGLGDLLCAVPAFRALRRAFPQAMIWLVGLPQAQGLMGRFSHYLDGWLEFPGFPGLPERSPQLAQIPSFLADLQQREIDLALQMHGSGYLTNPLIALFGAKRTAGFFQPGQFCPDPTTFLSYPDRESEVRRYLRLLEFLGIPSQGEQMEFPLGDGDWLEFQTIATACGLHSGEYVCIHPGASVAERRWAAERFAEVADRLAAQGYRIVLTGSLAETALTAQVAGGMSHLAIDLAGQTSLGALAVLLRQSRLLVCNDTGVSHLAAAVGVPSVVVFNQSDPERWAPLDLDRHRAIHHPLEVSPSTVLTEVWELLQREAAHVA